MSCAVHTWERVTTRREAGGRTKDTTCSSETSIEWGMEFWRINIAVLSLMDLTWSNWLWLTRMETYFGFLLLRTHKDSQCALSSLWVYAYLYKIIKSEVIRSPQCSASTSSSSSSSPSMKPLRRFSLASVTPPRSMPGPPMRFLSDTSLSCASRASSSAERLGGRPRPRPWPTGACGDMLSASIRSGSTVIRGVT